MGRLAQILKLNRQLKHNPMKSKILSGLTVIICIVVSGARLASAQGTAFNYQGRLNTNGSPALGLYDFRSAIYDAVTNGAQIGGALTNAAVGVTNGVFTVTLDFGDGIFTGPARWLDLSVRTNGGVFTNLVPRTALLAVPYAIYAGQANSVTNGAISVRQLQTPGAPTNGQALSYNGTSLVWQTLAPGSAAYVAKAGDTMTGALNLAAPANLGFGNNVRQMINLWDVVYGIGVQDYTFYQRTGSGFAWYRGGSFTNTQNSPGSGGVTLMTLDPSGNLTANGGVNIAGDAYLSSDTFIYGTVYGYAGIVGESTTLDGSGSGVIGYGERPGTVGTASRGVLGQSYNNDGVEGISTTSTGVHAESTSGYGMFGHSQGNIGVFGQTAADAQAGVLGRNDGPTGNGGRAVFGYASTGAIGVNGVSEVGDGMVGESHGAGRSGVVGLSSSATGYGGYFYNTGGGVALHVNGSAEVNCLTIFGGCDVAEPFPMSAPAIPQGAVVVIDAENAGQLKLSNRAYDTRVAGIVSGANGINPGVSLHQEGVLEGGQNVALSGRVYVLADAATGAIQPGDLLTTSDTPGHAMKVTDHSLAQGAILGKAMSSLQEGKGKVLVLVTLQ